MTSKSLFYDYINSDGANVIKTWLDQLDPTAKARVNNRLNALEQLDRAD